MVFAWRAIQFWLVPITVVLVCATTMYRVRIEGPWIRVPLWIACTLVGLPLAALLGIGLLVQGIDFGTRTISAPLYSPSGDRAVRIESWDNGGLGAGSDVVVYAHHGLTWRIVSRPFYKSVDLRDLHWRTNADLDVSLRWNDSAPECNDAYDVHVTCQRRPDPFATARRVLTAPAAR